jgi:hypothetical protein
MHGEAVRVLIFHFDSPGPAATMAADLIAGLDLRPILRERGHGTTMHVRVPRDLVRLIGQVAAIHGGRPMDGDPTAGKGAGP